MKSPLGNPAAFAICAIVIPLWRSPISEAGGSPRARRGSDRVSGGGLSGGGFIFAYSWQFGRGHKTKLVSPPLILAPRARFSAKGMGKAHARQRGQMILATRVPPYQIHPQMRCERIVNEKSTTSDYRAAPVPSHGCRSCYSCCLKGQIVLRRDRELLLWRGEQNSPPGGVGVATIIFVRMLERSVITRLNPGCVAALH